MRVCYFGTYRVEYARNQILIEGLRRNGVEVIECHQSLWQGVDDRVNIASGGWRHPSFWLRLVRTYFKLLQRFTSIPANAYDVLVVGYPGHYDVFLARLLAWISGKPLVWDVLNSLYLITLERGIHTRSPATGWLIRNLERLACRLPDLMLLDTSAFIRWFCELHQLNPERFRIVQIGADERYYKVKTPALKENGVFRVIYYGSYIPNHGVSTIVEAAHLLEKEDAICFEMIGTGPDLPAARAAASRFGLHNIQFIDWLEHAALAEHIARADVVLGVFGTTVQNTLTNNNKIYEGFAMRKPVISAGTPALPPILQHGEHLYLCERGQPQSLADAIQTLNNDPQMRDRLATAGQKIFFEHFSVDCIGQQFSQVLQELIRKGD